MSDGGGPGRAGPAEQGAPAYCETLRTPWWWYPAGAAIAGVLAAEFHIPHLGITDWLPYVILVPLTLAVVWWIGRARLEISGGELRIRKAHLPLRYVSGAVALDERTLRRVVGREGDPAAFVSVRPWIGPGVQVWIDDAEDPTPYWVVSSRHPDQLVKAVRAAL
jgi:hypothetical protein